MTSVVMCPAGVIFTKGKREEVQFRPSYIIKRALPHVAPGRYRLKVVADDEWKVSITEVPTD
jgi:hypothetical protein